MSSERFENLEEDYRTLIDQVKDVFDRKLASTSGEGKKRLLRDAEKNVEEASLVLQELESELRKAPATYRNQMVNKVRGYRKDVDNFSSEIRRAKSGFGQYSDRSALFGTNEPSDFEKVEQSQRDKLLQGTAALSRASGGVERAQRIAAETDQIGVDIIDELGTQREALVRTKGRLDETDAGLRRSRKILRSMARKMMTNKLILALVILVEVAILIGLVYWKFFS